MPPNHLKQSISELKEPLLRKKLTTTLEADFFLHHEVSGIHLLTGDKVRADLLCYPRNHLINHGFAATWFIIETKHLNFSTHESKRLYMTAWQAITYRHSEFFIAGATVRPAFAALFVNDSPPNYSNLSETAQRRRWDILTEFILYANVGYFRLDDSGRWKLFFGRGRYFDSKTGISKVPRGLKKYVGSKSKKTETT